MKGKYKIGDKIVLTVSEKDEERYYPIYIFNDNFYISEQGVDEHTEPLTAYTEPLEAKIRRQAAEITRLLAENKKLKEQMKFDLPTLISEEDRRRMDINKARAEGAEAAWELASKIALYGEGAYSGKELKEIFDCTHTQEIIRNNTYHEAAAKVAEWEKAKEIKVGDIVRLQEGSGNDLCILCKTSDEKYYNAVDKYGALYPLLEKEHFNKTGRHIDIDGFLKQIGGGQE